MLLLTFTAKIKVAHRCVLCFINSNVNTTRTISYYHYFTRAACSLLTQQAVYGAAEQLTGSGAALLHHPLHHLDEHLHAGGLDELGERKKGLQNETEITPESHDLVSEDGIFFSVNH